MSANHIDIDPYDESRVAPVVPLRDRTIGTLLVDAGRLTPGDAERVLQFQRERGLQFGEAALELGLISREDIRHALGRQFDYAVLPAGDTSMSQDVLAAFQPNHVAVEALRQLRSQLILRWLDPLAERKSVTIVGTRHGEGRTFIASNLAVLFSQLGERTLLIDADLRKPTIDRLFHVDPSIGLTTILSERAGLDAIVKHTVLKRLTVMPAGPLPPNPQELLSRPTFSRLLRTAYRHFDVVILDTPAWSSGADAQIVAARAGAALVVASRDHTESQPLNYLVDALRNSGSNLLGLVANRF